MTAYFDLTEQKHAVWHSDILMRDLQLFSGMHHFLQVCGSVISVWHCGIYAPRQSEHTLAMRTVIADVLFFFMSMARTQSPVRQEYLAYWACQDSGKDLDIYTQMFIIESFFSINDNAFLLIILSAHRAPHGHLLGPNLTGPKCRDAIPDRLIGLSKLLLGMSVFLCYTLIKWQPVQGATCLLLKSAGERQYPWKDTWQLI